MKSMVSLDWRVAYDPKSEIMRRLHCAAGQLHAVLQMTEAGQPCIQILHQLNAAHAALRTVAVMMFEEEALVFAARCASGARVLRRL